MRFYRLLLIVTAFYVLMPGYSQAEDAVNVVAVVNGAELTAAELGQEKQKIAPMELGFHGGMPEEKLKEIETKALSILLDKELQYQDAVAKGLKIEKKLLAAEKEKLAARFKSKGEFTKALEVAGFTEKSLTRFIERNILAERIKHQEVNEKVKITDQMVKEYYEKNKDKYFKPEEFRASHILVKVDPTASAEDKVNLKARAEALLEKIKDGADFGEVAVENSDDMSRIKGGDIGYFHAGRIVPEFEAVILTMKVGEISGTVETIYGYHIIKLTEKKLPHQMQFDEVREKIKASLTEREQKSLFEQWMGGLKAKAKIVYPEKG
jgi:parvulin-like peptidyl-prolyl isomerase